ncbi:MAG TPA: HAMP domain-containing sensor histidine kinase [Chloroflexota bacterium]|nr:HAMP domain-containing sensor histidine kinase [Chloroflexota bacterium]
MSLRLRLTLFFTAVLAASLLGFSVLLYLMLEHTLALDIDHAIASKAEDVARTSRIRGEYPPRRRRIRLPQVDAFASPEIYIQLLDAEGLVVDRSANLGDHQLPLTPTALAQGRQGSPWYDTLLLDGQPLRLYTAPLLIDDDVIGFIQVARSLQDYEQTLAHMQRLLLICDSLVIVTAGLVGWALARASLRPIDRVTQAARAIGLSGRLDRRLDPVPRQDEVGRLVATFNEMLDRLEAAFAAQRRFVADASHELRTPLTTIRGNVELLRRARDLPPEEIDEALADIASEAERMSRLVTELLRLARADAGLDLERAPVPLDQVLRDVHRQMQLHKPEIRVQLAPLAPALVLGSRDALQELFLILVDNALKYTPAGGEVTIGLDRQDGWYTAWVRDTGVGIDPEDLPHIFERFYRSTKVRQQGGTGLGLAIARWIAEQHNGRITVESTPGQGSTFTVWLPVPTSWPAPAPEVPPLVTAPRLPAGA